MNTVSSIEYQVVESLASKIGVQAKDEERLYSYWLEYFLRDSPQLKCLGFVAAYGTDLLWPLLKISKTLNKELLIISLSDIALVQATMGSSVKQGFLLILVRKVVNEIISRGHSRLLVLIDEIELLPASDGLSLMETIRAAVAQSIRQSRDVSSPIKEGCDTKDLFILVAARDFSDVPVNVEVSTEFFSLAVQEPKNILRLLEEPAIKEILHFPFRLSDSAIKALESVNFFTFRFSQLPAALGYLMAYKRAQLPISSTIDEKNESEVLITEKDVYAVFHQRQQNSTVINLPNHSGRVAVAGIVNGNGVVQRYEAIFVPGTGAIKLCCATSESLVYSLNLAYAAVSEMLAQQKQDRALEEKDAYFNILNDEYHITGRSASLAIALTFLVGLNDLKLSQSIGAFGLLTLRGEIIECGALKEKILACAEQGIELILMPHAQRKIMEEIPDFVKRNIRIMPVSNLQEAYSTLAAV